MSTLPAFPGAPRIGGYSFLNPCLLLRQAGQGGMGMVYEAFDVLRDQRVALKTCTNPAYSPRFYSEAIIGVGDFGEHVVQVLDIRAFQNTDYILMEWVEGTDLSRWTRDRILTDGELIGVALQLCRGLARIHEGGIIHRDIKPANLMLTTSGLIKLADFGIAQAGEALHMPTTGPIGTQLFMSPEQREGLPVDGRSDLYSVGVTLYVMATGLLGRERSSKVRELLIRGLEPIAGVAKTMDDGLARIIDRCIQTAPEDRFASVEELESALQAVEHLSEPILPTVSDTPTEQPPRDTVHQARTRMMSLNRDDPGTSTLAPTIPDRVAPAPTKTVERARAEPIPAVRPGAHRKPVLVAALAVPLLALVTAYAITGDRTTPAEGGTAQETETPEESLAAAPVPPLGLEAKETGAGPTDSADSPKQESAPTDSNEPPTTAVDAKSNQPEGPADNSKSPGSPENAAEQVALPAAEQLTPSPQEPDAQDTDPQLPELAGFDVHTDKHGRLAYVPKLEQELGSPRKLRFVAPNTPKLEGYLVQEVEVSLELAAKLGLVADAGDDPCLPWDRVNRELAENLVAGLNANVPADAKYRFVVPTIELRQQVERAAGDCQLEHAAETQTHAPTKIGNAPATQAMGMARLEKVDEPKLWFAFGGTGLYGLVGNAAELCLDPQPSRVDFRGGAAQDLAVPGSTIRSDQSMRAVSTLRRAGLGLRLFIRL